MLLSFRRGAHPRDIHVPLVREIQVESAGRAGVQTFLDGKRVLRHGYEGKTNRQKAHLYSWNDSRL
jgi:hypothetical protein